MSSSIGRSASGIMSVTRDWSDGAALAPSISQESSSSVPRQPRARPAPLTEEQRAARTAKRLQVLETTLSQPTSSPPLSGTKRPSDGASELEPPAKRIGLSNGAITTGEVTDKKPAIISIAAQITLSQEQQEILKLVTSGKNIFFTGSAGVLSFLSFYYTSSYRF